MSRSANDVHVNVREYADGDKPYRTLTVRPHWNWSDRATLSIGDQAEAFVVLIRDLRAALDACEKGKP